MNRISIVLTTSFVLAAGVLSGCATTGGLTGSKATPEALKARALERSTERWKLLNNKKYSETFEFLSPSSREQMTAASYGASLRRLNIISGEPVADSVKCTEEVCELTVQMVMNVRVPRVPPQKLTAPVQEHWVLSDGELWLTRR